MEKKILTSTFLLIVMVVTVAYLGYVVKIPSKTYVKLPFRIEYYFPGAFVIFTLIIP